MIRIIRLIYGGFAKIGTLLQSPFLLIIRLYWGYQFCLTGWGKLTNLSNVAEYFTQLGLPLPKFQAILVGCTECAGGALLLVGLFSRLAALPLAFTLIVAYAVSEQEALHKLWDDQDPFFAAKPFTFLMASLIVFIFGPGAFSLDRWILKRA
jgi:putative oxidoreductase